jgi:hypothetical protein
MEKEDREEEENKTSGKGVYLSFGSYVEGEMEMARE